MVHIYIDLQGFVARSISADIPLSDNDVYDFMVGFTQSQPLFNIVDVGHDSEKLIAKMESMCDSTSLLGNRYLLPDRHVPPLCQQRSMQTRDIWWLS